ncbi:MAG TPA: hypothetical protein VI861_03195, partial [Rickettsiales bacterium]|nr:hypothetical protein [Rickettsiales bacterium]
DILQLIQDLMEITHKTVKIKLIKDEKSEEFPAAIFEKLKEIAQKISLSSLTKFWQMLLKGNQEISYANSPKITFEILIIRICHLSSLIDLKKALIAANSDNKIQNENNLQKKLDEKNNLVNDKEDSDLAQEILRNFEGAKLIS